MDVQILADQLLTNLRAATMNGTDERYGLVENAAIAIQDGRIAWVGDQQALPSHYAAFAKTDLGGRMVTPALIDCHTHIVFGGNRATEFELRLNGASYEDVARAGGGIISTVKATRAATVDALVASALPRIDAMIAEGVADMARAGTTAVILPGAFYTLHEKQMPPIALFRKHTVPMALATDCNPGSSPMTSLLLTMNMGCTLFRMTPLEALQGTTTNAARALGLNDCGSIAVGKRADLAVWNIEHPAELSYRIGFNPLHARLTGD